jgi:Ca2+-binding EF-hand superfamily protein
MRLHERTTGKALSREETDLIFELLDADEDGRLKLDEVGGALRLGRGSKGL